MTDEQKKNNSLLNRLIIYMGTSDDLIFWVLTDILYLSTVKGFTDMEISMVFTGAFWSALILSLPYFLFIKKIKIQNAMIINQALFFIASFLLLISQAVVTVIIAQSIYFLAADSFNIGDILMHDLCRKSSGRRDFVKCRSWRAAIYGVLSLGLALLVYPLMQVNGALPMMIGTCMAAGSLIVVISIARDFNGIVPFTKDAPTAQGSSTADVPTAQGSDTVDASIAQSSTTDVTTAQGSSTVDVQTAQGSDTAAQPTVRRLLDIGSITYSRTTWAYVLLAIFTDTFLTIFVTNGKILLNDDITMVYGAGRAVAIFSGVIILTRVTKTIGNAIPRLMQKKVKKYQGIAVAVVSILLIVMALILLSFSQLQSSPVLVGIGLAIVCTVYDPLFNITRYLFLNGLSEQQELSAVYIVNLIGNILRAVLSSIITMILLNSTMLSVMQLLTLVAIITLIISIFGLGFYRKAKKQ